VAFLNSLKLAGMFVAIQLVLSQKTQNLLEFWMARILDVLHHIWLYT
jgi:hypothetical protein